MKPIIKWVGGKTQIIEELYKYFPLEINNYYETFIGGGSVFLKLLEKLENKTIKLNGKIFLSDKNEKLINLYKTIKNNHEELLEILNELKNNYNKSNKVEHKKRTSFKVMDEDEIEKDKKNQENLQYFILIKKLQLIM